MELSTAKKPDIAEPDEVKQQDSDGEYENAFDDEPQRVESKGNKEKTRYDEEEDEPIIKDADPK